jgi:hypothetical protein
LRLSAVLIFIALLCRCGGGGGGGGSSPDNGGDAFPNPDVALLFVSGHEGLFDTEPSRSYLHQDLGPALEADVRAAGFSTATFYFVDHYEYTDAPGFDGLIDTLLQIRDGWISGRSCPTRIVVVAHSHGGVWASAAIRQLQSVPIALQVALDHSSYGWGLVGHDAASGLLGGDPRDFYSIGVNASCPNSTGISNESGNAYDLEDVVQPNVALALEVRSGEPVLLLGEPFDERWNVRLDGSFTGMYCYHSATDHSEVAESGGTTYPVVRDWILAGLAIP